MNKKSLYIIFGAVLVFVVVLVWIFWDKSSKETETGPAQQVGALPLAQEVEGALDKKASLIEGLVKDSIIIDEVKRSNEAHKDISLDEILKLDQRWRNAEGIDEFIEPFLANDVAIRLLEFQELNLGFSEIFITDEYGLNVGQTNKTTDYYQADEDWWIGAYNSGAGKLFHGAIEFDESAQAEAISIYVPVNDPVTKKTIGVAKAVLSIAAIKIEL